MQFEHERPTASETTPLLVPPTCAEESQEASQQLGGELIPQFEWNKIVWVVVATWSGVFLGALDGGQKFPDSFTFA